MANEIILHVGPHKTGSTALQHAFADQSDALDTAGVRYAQAGRAGHAHHGIVDWVHKLPTGYDPQAVRDEAETVPRLLLSSENVVHLSDRPMQRLRNELPEGEVSIVFYLRRLRDLWPSHWQELVKHGSSLTFAEYLAAASFTSLSPRNYGINQLHQLLVLERVFGKQSIRIVGYDHLRAMGADIYAHFVRDVLGLEIEGTGEGAGRVNATQPFWTTELLRLFNVIHHEVTGEEARAPLRVAVMDAVEANAMPFLGEFVALAEERAGSVTVRGDGPFIVQQRGAIRRHFEPCIVGDAEAVIEAYSEAEHRTVRSFVFPRTGAEALLSQLVEFYHSLQPSEGATRGEKVSA